MTKDEFWQALDNAWSEGDMKRFWDIWNGNPKIVDEWNAEFEKNMADPNSELRKKHDLWWSNMKPKIIAYYGEEWAKEHIKD